MSKELNEAVMKIYRSEDEDYSDMIKKALTFSDETETIRGRVCVNRLAQPAGRPNSAEVYDHVNWHYPDQEEDLEKAGGHIVHILNWLYEHGFLTAKGREAYNIVVTQPGAMRISSDMLNDDGNIIMMNYYEKWLDTIKPYKKKYDLKDWNKLVKLMV